MHLTDPLVYLVGVAGVSKVDCILNCDKESISADPKAYLHLPMVVSL